MHVHALEALLNLTIPDAGSVEHTSSFFDADTLAERPFLRDRQHDQKSCHTPRSIHRKQALQVFLGHRELSVHTRRADIEACLIMHQLFHVKVHMPTSNQLRRLLEDEYRS